MRNHVMSGGGPFQNLVHVVRVYVYRLALVPIAHVLVFKRRELEVEGVNVVLINHDVHRLVVKVGNVRVVRVDFVVKPVIHTQLQFILFKKGHDFVNGQTVLNGLLRLAQGFEDNLSGNQIALFVGGKQIITVEIV